MKKLFTVLFIAVLITASVFAGNFSVRSHATAFPFFLTVPMIGDDFIDINADLEMNYYVSDNFRIGIEADVNYPIVKNEDVALADIAKAMLAKGYLFAKMGYVAHITEAFDFAIDAGFGGCLFADTKCMGATLQFSGAFLLSDRFSLEAGVKADAIIKDNNALPIWYPMLGIEYKF